MESEASLVLILVTRIFFIFFFNKIVHVTSDIHFYNVCMHMHSNLIISYYKMNIIFMTG